MAHAADFLARIVIANTLFGQRHKASDLVIPWCTYTDPQLAHIGCTESQAESEGVEIDIFKQPLDDVDRALLDGETEGFVKVHMKNGTDRITRVRYGVGCLAHLFQRTTRCTKTSERR